MTLGYKQSNFVYKSYKSKVMKILNPIILICVFLLAISCSEEDIADKYNNTGVLTVKGIDYQLADGIIWNRFEENNDNDGIYNWDIDLFSEGLDPINETGSGHGAAMELYTHLSSGLAIGTYTHAINDNYTAGTFCGNIIIGMDAQTESISKWYVTTSGTIVMDKAGSIYDFTMNMLADEYDVTDEFDFIQTGSDIAITCTYKGTLLAKKEEID